MGNADASCGAIRIRPMTRIADWAGDWVFPGPTQRQTAWDGGVARSGPAAPRCSPTGCSPPPAQAWAKVLAVLRCSGPTYLADCSSAW